MTSASGEPSGCVFCNTTEPGRDELLLFRGRSCFVVLNLYPYNNGHLMVVPNRHVASLHATTTEERAELMQLTRLAEMALEEAYRPDGINVGINLGRAAGAGVPGHLHVHMLPRWSGDTNFMTTVADARVLPEDLKASKTRLVPIFERLATMESQNR